MNDEEAWDWDEGRCPETIPEEPLELPTEGIPEGYGLLVLQQHCHSSGSLRGRRIFAATKGGWMALTDGALWFSEDDVLMIGDEPVVHVFCDSNSEYSYDLPAGSLEWTPAGWMPQTEARYFY